VPATAPPAWPTILDTASTSSSFASGARKISYRLAVQRVMHHPARHLGVESVGRSELSVQDVLLVVECGDLIVQISRFVTQSGQHRVRQDARAKQDSDCQRQEHSGQ
jgi:hypothetical protein